MRNVYDIVAEAADAWPERVAIHDDRGAMTFAELARSVEVARRALVARGVGAGHGLGVRCRNGRDFLVGVFAGLGAGAVVMPLAPSLTRSELTALMQDAPLHALLDDGSGVAPVLSLSDVLSMDDAELRFAWTGRDRSLPFLPEVPDAAFVRFTSGTTGQAKGVVVSHGSVLARTAAAERSLGLGPDDTVVWVLPMAYHFIVTIVMYVRFGVTIAVSPGMLAETIVATANAHGATMLYAAPTHYRMLAACAGVERMPSLRRAISTSAGIPAAIAERFRGRFGVPVSQVYGIIEVGLPVGNLQDAEAHPGSIGRAFPDFEVAILDDDHVPLPPGEVGHLAMRGPGMFDAYMSPFRLRDDVLERGWFMTGDLAVVDDTGLITVAGRRKSMINAAGLKVFPEEVEAVLDGFPGVLASRVLGEPHPLLGEVVVAQIEEAPGSQVDLDELRRYCRERLSMHKVPQRIERVNGLARTRTGKVLRHASG